MESNKFPKNISTFQLSVDLRLKSPHKIYFNYSKNHSLNPNTKSSIRKSCNCWVLAVWQLATAAANGDNYWMSCGRSCDDRRGSEEVVVSVAAGNEREPVAWISDACAAAQCSCWDDGVGGFLLVVISVACASLRTRRTEFQSYGMP